MIGRFGWKKDPFNPRAIYLRHWALQHDVELKILPQVDLTRYTEGLGLPWDQNGLGECTGFGIAVNFSARAVEQKVFDKINFGTGLKRFSPRFIYRGELDMEGNTGHDEGAYPEDGFIFCERHGLLPDQFLPDIGKLPDEPLDDSFDTESSKWPSHGHYRVDNGIQGLQAALSVGNFLSIGTPWFAKWCNDVPTSGVLPMVTMDDDIAGGHETCLFGYRKIDGHLYFWGVNSWGSAWGLDGWYWMPASAFLVFKQMGGYDAMFPKLPWRP